jgi:hypothetical protein
VDHSAAINTRSVGQVLGVQAGAVVDINVIHCSIEGEESNLQCHAPCLKGSLLAERAD